MGVYFLVDHKDWDEPRRIFRGPNSNTDGLGPDRVQTIGSSPDCQWVLPDLSLPDIVAFIAHLRHRRNYICELNVEDYGSTNRADFLKRKPVLRKVLENFDVAGYRFMCRYQGDAGVVVENRTTEAPVVTAELLMQKLLRTSPDYVPPSDDQLSDEHYYKYQGTCEPY